MVGLPLEEESFRGTARYEVRRRLGHGGMGVVYHVYDRVRSTDVALKTLRHADASSIYRLKKEFRALADISHKNLVTLHELVGEGGLWYFTMELVTGVNFISHVRQAGAYAVTQTSIEVQGVLHDKYPSTESRLREPFTDLETKTSPGEGDDAETFIDPPVPQRSILNVRRLRNAFRQLAEGLHALHSAGFLHRDIKPSNVLVTRDGRVVVLDFGLAAELLPFAFKSQTEQGRLVGTPAYMSPEQAGETPLTAAADWYAVGIMLYECLTGRLPFPGSGLEQLLRKYQDTPLRVSAVAPGTPADLEELCMALLARHPSERPRGEEILARLEPGMRAPSVSGVAPRTMAARSTSFVGRADQLAQLEVAYQRAKVGHPTAVYVRGSSGMGKTALARHFLEHVRIRDDALVLEGRCYERESVPYKAVDSVIDALSLHLRSLSRLEVEALLPRDVRALTRVFPVLDRVEAIAEAPARRSEIADQTALRRRAFHALKELLARISDRRMLVVYVDDLQWGDLDSAALMLDLMRPPEPPGMLVIGCYRWEDEKRSPLLRELLGGRAELFTMPIHLERPRMITVGPLSEDEATQLAAKTLGESSEGGRARAIAKESGGHPFWVETLARHAKSTSAEGGGDLSLEGVLRERLSRLTDSARQLLEVVAIAGKPVSSRAAAAAAGLGRAEETAAADLLRAANLVRTTGAEEDRAIETYHDRIRETVAGDLEADVCAARHRSLAVALEMLDPNDAEALYVHFKEAGDRLSAGMYAATAAEQATRALAFGHAAMLYQEALDLVPGREEAERRRLRVRLAEALANAGRGTEAAHAFLESAASATAGSSGTPLADVLEHRRRAAEQYLFSGRIQEGLGVLQSVLRDVGYELARTPDQAYASVVENRARLVARGLGFSKVDASQVSQEKLRTIDILGTAALGLVMIDTVRGADFQLRHLLLALDAGEPLRVARALATEALYLSASGGRKADRLAELTQAAIALSKDLRDPYAVGLCALSIGATAFLKGEFRRARTQLERTQQLLRDRCTGVAWELATARIFHAGALAYLGELRELRERVLKTVEDADARGDVYASTVARCGRSSLLWLMVDHPAEAMSQVAEAMAAWPADAFYVQHWLAHCARCDVLLYQRRGRAAYRDVCEVRPKFEESRLSDTQYLWIDGLWLRARAALAASAEGGADREGLLEIAQEDASTLAAEGMPWSVALSLFGRGLAELARDDRTAAIRDLGDAISALDEVGMAHDAACARHRLGVLVGGTSGAHLVTAARGWMEKQGVTKPASMFDRSAPVPDVWR